MAEIDAYILVGGRSSRMGRDKATVDLGGQTLGHRAFRSICEALPDSRVTFVAGNQAQFAIEAILAEARFIFDQVPDRGPLGGLHSALADAKAPWIFVLACDYPFVTPDLIRFLAQYTYKDHNAVIPIQNDGRLQPLCAFYNVEQARPLVQQIIERPRVPPPLHKIVRELNPRIIEPAEFADLRGSEAFFTNVNTNADLDLANEIERKLSVEK